MSERQIEFPHDLVEFAQDLQNQLTSEPFDRQVTLAFEAIRLLGSTGLNRYEQNARLLIDSKQSFWKPHQKTEPTQEIVMFGASAIEGYAPNFSFLCLGDIEVQPLGSICLAVSRVRLFPGGNSLPEDDKIHIPVMAVENILQLS